MKKHVFTLFYLALPFITLAQNNYTVLLDRYTQGFAAAHDFTGAVLVAKKGKVVYQKAFGAANREWNIPNTVDTRFPIASLTKQFTAAAILQLAEQGKLRIEDKLSKYFPDYPKGDSVTLHMLLNHTSGIPNLLQDPKFTEINADIPIEKLKDTFLINIFKQKPYDFSPGTYWRYSNSGYILLGYIIEKVSRQTYRDFVYKNILQKAGMKNSDLFRYDTILPHRASGYSRTQNGWKNSRIININISFSAGALFSTVEDLFRWNEALFSGKLIADTSLAKMNRPNHEDRGAGYGVFVENIEGRRAIFHSGGLLGFSSYLIRYPEEAVSIIILTNRETNLDFLQKGLAAILFDKKVTAPYKHTSANIDSSVFRRYIGDYKGENLPFTLAIVEKSGKLYHRLHRDIELVPESETKFFVAEPDVDIQIEFVLNDRKEVTRVYFIEAGIKSEVKRK